MRPCDFPTGRHAAALLQGKAEGVVGSAAWTASRAGLLALGMYLAGERESLLKKSIVGSVCVEAVVIGSVLLTGDVPSARAAVSANPLAIAATYLARSAAIAGSLHLAGEREHIWRNALAGAAVVELTVLAWAHRCRTYGVP